MLLRTYFEQIYKHTLPEAFHPSRKNAGVLVLHCLSAAGSPHFKFSKEKRYTSEDVPTERKYFDGSRSMTEAVKASFHDFNVDAVTTVIMGYIDKQQMRELMLDFGIPPNLERNINCLCRALAIQLKHFVDSLTDEASDIVLLEYQRLLFEPQDTRQHIQPLCTSLYTDDSVYLKSKYRPTYTVDIYQVFQHTWEFENAGIQTWRGRKLFFSNHDAVRPKADHIYIDIPDTPPNKGVQLTVTMDARGFEGSYECNWVMIDSGGNNCYPNSNQFSFVINTRFSPKK